jgi:Sulfotransferase domain
MSEVIISFGLPRSGSTWVYNALRRLLAVRTAPIALFSDNLAATPMNWPAQGQALLVKTHDPSAEMISFASFVNAKWIVCVRDPRDCVVSAMEVFGVSATDAVSFVEKSLRAWVALTAAVHDIFLIRYEDISDRSKICREMAEYLGIDVDVDLIDKIVEELEPDSVKNIIDGAIQEGVLDPENPVSSWMPEQQWHPNHIGDGKIGKFMSRLNLAISRRLFSIHHDFFERFRYEDVNTPRVEGEEPLHFNADAAMYLENGFSGLEAWGVWSDGEESVVKIPVSAPATRLRVEIDFQLSPAFRSESSNAKCIIYMNGEQVSNLDNENSLSNNIRLVCTAFIPLDGVLEIRFQFDNLKSPSELGLSDDCRRLGVGLERMRIASICGPSS